ncbi:hypothetical protein RHMOL_Rhmol09G0080800 [Rhododendron molle]|uniref:Uncharacterized protein n=1 Tax=Rhododendron molle TaxID=49168 RepID=A0ACC0MB42_RHOML|nr:hypothetical protein RHMOL_Rhmol09G0080800 [Rhododendron molle]
MEGDQNPSQAQFRFLPKVARFRKKGERVIHPSSDHCRTNGCASLEKREREREREREYQVC